MSASITGWSEHEALPGAPQLPEGLDPWQTEAWEDLYNQEWLGAYWPCMTAILQVAVYPREAGGVVGDDDYPHIVDFEPKKRELYEAVTSTGEVMSGSNNRLQVQKGNTSTRGTESAMSAEAGFSVAGVGAGLNITQRSMSSFETVNMTTTDASAEKRESAGFSTSLSQMYQLFNGYHVGTNRAVFVIVGRPHTVTDAAQVDNNLINGERVLEGVQEVFLVVNVPRTLDGVCVEAWLDTGHKHKTTETSGWPLDFPTPTVITRRIVGGCSTIVGDRLVPLPAGAAPLPPMVVGEPVIDPGPAFGGLSPGEVAMRSVADQVTVANRLNLLQGKIRSAALAASATSIYTPRPYGETEAFRARVANGRADRGPMGQLPALRVRRRPTRPLLRQPRRALGPVPPRPGRPHRARRGLHRARVALRLRQPR